MPFFLSSPLSRPALSLRASANSRAEDQCTIHLHARTTGAFVFDRCDVPSEDARSIVALGCDRVDVL
eukprot:2084118-Rhodomonas_salina.3